MKYEKYKVEFYIGLHSPNPFVSPWKVVNVEVPEGTEHKEIIKRAKKELGAYPRSLSSKVVKIEGEKNVVEELRELMQTYVDGSAKLDKEYEEAKAENNEEDKHVIEVLQRQRRIMIAQLFKVMTFVGALDDEEIEIGAFKGREGKR
jgi:hypothetical protein